MTFTLPRPVALASAFALALHVALPLALPLALVQPAHAQLPPVPVSPVPVRSYEYDANGNLTKVTKAPGTLNLSTRHGYDSLERLRQTVDARNGAVQREADGQDRTTQVTDPRNLATHYERSGLGEVQRLLSPDTGATDHTYDAAGNLTSRTDSRGVKTTYTWDALNRLKTATAAGAGFTAETHTWLYDQNVSPYITYGVGRLTGVEHPAGFERYGYNAHGALTTVQWQINSGSVNTAVTRVVSYGRDLTGRIASITYPSGRVVQYTYVNGLLDSISLKASATSAAVPLLTQIQHQAFGPPRSWNWGYSTGSKPHERVYDLSGRLVRYPLGNTVRDLRYDDADRIASYTHYDATTGASQPTLDQRFEHDELDRLTAVQTATATWGITYDANDNRTGLTLNGSPQLYTTADSSNRLLSITNPARSFTHDAAGNTTTDSTRYSATYGVTGRLVSTKTGATNTQYAYNPAGQRIRKTQGSAASTRLYWHDPQSGLLMGEYDSSGKPVMEFVWMGSTPVALVVPDPKKATNPPQVFFVHADHLDTPRMVLDASARLRWRWWAEPFGTTAAETNPERLGALELNLRFPGQYFDRETGLHYNWHRDYDASVGRYVQSDPIGLAGGINTYAYVEGNPLSYVDPEGLAVLDCSRPADLPWPLSKVKHQWLKTDTVEAGMGATPGVIPAQGNIDLPFTPTQLIDHSGQSSARNASCESAPPKVDEQCVNEKLKLGRATGRWSPWNQCQSFVKDVIAQCTK